MNIIVFGGSGFLGSHVCDKLSDAGYNVTIFDIKPSPFIRSDQKMIVGDMLDEKKVQQSIMGAEIVFNFAGIADIGEANLRPIDTVRSNILGNAIILEACRIAGVKRYIFASSVYVYSKTGGFYRCSKQACELYIETYYENYGLEYTILRYGSLYGPRADENNAIYRFVLQALADRKINYLGSPEALREYIHVEDAAECSVEILKSEYANQSIILTGHQPMKVGDVLKMITEMIGEDIQFEYENDPNNVHYLITPYSFSPKVGKKMAPPFHMDFGQGILRVIEDVHKKLHPELHNINGVLVKEQK
jgi:UDP-glucose 4-epimerase